MDEELVINEKPCPGIQVFNCSNCLRYFTRETLLKKQLGSTASENYLDNIVFYGLHHVASEPEKLFYLMSVCPEEETVNICLNYWKHNQRFTISVDDVIYVFLNWGATPENLGVHDDKQISPRLTATLAPTSLTNFPAPHNVKAVLDSILDWLQGVERVKVDQDRFNLIKVLVSVSLDVRMQQFRSRFNEAFCKALETFPVWTRDKVLLLVEHLNLLKMGLQNATYICCSLFTSSARVQDFKEVAARHLLHSKFGLTPPLEPFHTLLENLPPTEKIVDRFCLLEIYVIIQLLNSLLFACCYRPKNHSDTHLNTAEGPPPMILIKRLHDVAGSVHSGLMSPRFMYDVESVIVKEKCVRLRADCVELMCILKNDAGEWQQDE